MTFLKNNWLTILAFVVLGAYIWRTNSLNYALRMSDSNAQKQFVISHLKEVEGRLKDIEVKSEADSIQRNEVLKKLPKYENNLSITRLKFIRDSLRARHALLDGKGVQ